MAARGGKRAGAGRKPKADETKLIEKLSPLMPIAYDALEANLAKGEPWAVKIAFEYFYGKPKQSIDQTTTVNISDFDIKEAIDFND